MAFEETSHLTFFFFFFLFEILQYTLLCTEHVGHTLRATSKHHTNLLISIRSFEEVFHLTAEECFLFLLLKYSVQCIFILSVLHGA